MPSQLTIGLLARNSDAFRALVAGRDAFRLHTGLGLAEGLLTYAEHMTEAYLATIDGLTPWTSGYFAIDAARRLAVGLGGFKGPPDREGTVEIAYATAPELQNRGYATATAGLLVDLAFRQPEIQRVIAHTLPEANSSGRVLTKSGFTRTDDVVDPDDGPVWRWERARN